MRAEFGLVPAKDVNAVQAHLAAGRGPQAHQQARQCGLARGRRPDDSDGVAWLHNKTDALDDGHGAAWGCCHHPFHAEQTLGRRQRQSGGSRWDERQQFVQAFDGVARVHHAAPLRNQLSQWREHAPAQHGRNDHHAAAAIELARQLEPARRAQDERAQHQLDLA